MSHGRRALAVAKRVLVGTLGEGFVQAGNLAYLSLLTLFPFFIVLVSFAASFGQTDDGLRAIRNFLSTLPPDVAAVVEQPIVHVVQRGTGAGILTFSILVGLWTTANFVEAMRGIVRRAYGAAYDRPFWHYQLRSVGLIVLSVFLVLLAFAAQIVLTAAEQLIIALFPWASEVLSLIQLGRFVPVFALFVALLFLFYSLTPARYRSSCRKWPGAVLTTVVWMGTTALLPLFLSIAGSYDVTYGSLAGVIIALLFFYIVGLGFVVGAQLNAALAEADRADGEMTAAAARS